MKPFAVIRTSADTWRFLPPWEKDRIKRALLARDGPYCSKARGHGCGKEYHPARLTIDHVIPIFKGGAPFDLANMQLLARDCHDAKTEAERVPPADLANKVPEGRLGGIERRLKHKPKRR